MTFHGMISAEFLSFVTSGVLFPESTTCSQMQEESAKTRPSAENKKGRYGAMFISVAARERERVVMGMDVGYLQMMMYEIV